MPTSTLEKKISVNNFFQNPDEISDALGQLNEKSEQALQSSDSAIARALSNENYLQSLIQSISTQNELIENVNKENVNQNTIINNVTNQIATIKRDDDNQTKEISKAFGILRGLYDSLGSAVQSLRSDVETISKYILDDQKQRQQQLEQREFRIAQQKDVSEKKDILKSLRKSMGVDTGLDTSRRDDNLPRPGGEKSFIEKLVSGAVTAAGIGLAGGMVGGIDSGAGGGDGGGGDGGGPSAAGGGGSQATTGTPEEKALLDAIAFAEGTTASYGKMFGGGISKDLESGKLTVKEVIDLGDAHARKNGESGASGRYQFMPPTLEMLVKMGVLKMDEKFTPQVQDKAAIALAKRRGVTSEVLKKEGLSARVSNLLAPEWASFPTYSGKSFYGQPVKSLKSIQSSYSQSLGSQSTTKPEEKKGKQQVAGQQSTSQAAPAAGQQTSAASEMKPGEEMAMRAPTGDVSAPFTGQTLPEKISEAQPPMEKMDTSSIVPFDYQPVQQMPSSGNVAQGSQTNLSNVSSSPDHPDAIQTNNPLTRMWTMSAINHLNINASMPHIYG